MPRVFGGRGEADGRHAGDRIAFCATRQEGGGVQRARDEFGMEGRPSGPADANATRGYCLFGVKPSF